MKKFNFIVSQIWKGERVTRSFLNHHLSTMTLVRKTIDVGGCNNSNYLSFMPKTKDCVFQTFDTKIGNNVNFEKDRLPFFSDFKFHFKIPRYKKHIFCGQPYWEAGKRGCSRKKIRSILSEHFMILSEYSSFENPYHRFFIMKVK